MINQRSNIQVCRDFGDRRDSVAFPSVFFKPASGWFVVVLGMVLGSDVFSRDEFKETIRPFVKKYCRQCHQPEKPKGELDFDRYKNAADIARAFRNWNHITDFVRQGEMPPGKETQPELAERIAFIDAVESILLRQTRRLAGDPGFVPPRRLSNVEYDLSVKDLTGVDIRATQFFPPDPAGGEGFTNTGEALRMSPSLLNKYLAAADNISNHLVLTPRGIRFAPYPVTSYNERKKYAEQAILDFYEQHSVQIEDYLEASWNYRFRSESDRRLSIEQWGHRQGLSPRYLALVWQTLNSSKSEGILREMKRIWNGLETPIDGKSSEGLGRLVELVELGRRTLGTPQQQLIKSNAGNWPIAWLDFRSKTAEARDRYEPKVSHWSQLVNAGRIVRQRNARKLNSVVLTFRTGFSGTAVPVRVVSPIFSRATALPKNEKERTERHQVQSLRSVLQKHDPQQLQRLGFGKGVSGESIDGDTFVVKPPFEINITISRGMEEELSGKHLLLPCELVSSADGGGSVLIQAEIKREDAKSPAAQQFHLLEQGGVAVQKIKRSSELFCNVFPNRFFYSDRNRGLAAGFHLVEGFFRDDQPLVEKVLSDEERDELDRLWQELNFITNSTETLLRGFVWFERSERHVLHDKMFDFLRPEAPDLTTTATLLKFERLYLKKLGVATRQSLGPNGSLQPEKPSDRFDMIHGFFEQIREGLKTQHRLQKLAEKVSLNDLMLVAGRAFQRPLQEKERRALLALYRSSRQSGRSIESSLRDVMIAILMSPDFVYRYRVSSSGNGTKPLNHHEMASRLSYFLWSTLPDGELGKLADAAQLSLETRDNSKVVIEQCRRMMKSDRMKDFCQEFFGHWFRYHDFLQKENINVKDFPQLDEDLRKSMVEEPTRVALEIIREDRSILEFINADYTYVNSVLADHYGGNIRKAYREQPPGIPPRRSTTADPNSDWRRILGTRKEGRGGLLGMAVILTSNSSGSRTSPVKRGFWVAHHLLGQHFPPPPEDVPELPDSEKESSSTIRELLKKHASHQQCALCHKHFDFLGLSMEGFDPIGRHRSKDLAGRRVDDSWEFNKGQYKGLEGLITLLEKERKDQFVRLFCRKLLGYALGRSVMLSDRPLLDEMESRLRKNGYRFSVAVETIVLSRQFTTIRELDFDAAKAGLGR